MVRYFIFYFHLDNYDKIVYYICGKIIYIGETGMINKIKMRREFVYTAPFRKCWKAMGLDDDNLLELEAALLDNPEIGDVIEGTGGARKMRIQLEGRGKRGGGRIIYLDVFEHENLYLLFAYPKNVQDDLTAEQKKVIRRMIEEIQRE